MNASVVIPTYNKAEYLELTLASFEYAQRPGVEIVIIDDGSTDRTHEVLKAYEKRLDLTVVRQPNGGRAAARNAGLRRASHDTIIFCDDDRIVGPTFIDAHLQALERDPRAVVIGWKRRMLTIWRWHLPIAGAEYELLRRRPGFFDEVEFHPIVRENDIRSSLENVLEQWQIGDEFDNYAPDSSACSSRMPWIYGTTANLSFNRGLGARDVYFDERYQGWGVEDTDLCYRLCRAGYHMSLSKKAVNYHQVHPLGSASLRSGKAHRAREAEINISRFCEQHRSLEAHLFRRVQQGMKPRTADLLLESAAKDVTGVLKEELRFLYAQQTYPATHEVALTSASGNTLWAYERVPEYFWAEGDEPALPTPATLREDGLSVPARPRVTDSFDQPLVTHKWWTPFLWQADQAVFCENTYPHPLCLRPTEDGLTIGYPTESSISPDNRTFEHLFRKDLTVELPTARTERRFAVSRYSDWLVDASWRDGGATLSFRAGRGLPSVFFQCSGLNEVTVTLSAPPRVLSQGADYVAFEVAGATYLIGHSEASTARLAEKELTLSGLERDARFSVHLLPDGSQEQIERFRRHRAAVPEVSRFSWHVDQRTSTIRLKYELEVGKDAPVGTKVLQAVYPHQWRRIAGPAACGEYQTPRGRMTLIESNEFVVELPMFGFLPYLPAVPNDDERSAASLQATLDDEPGAEMWKRPLEGWSWHDGYWAGKGLVRLADLAHCAESRGDRAARDRFVALMRTRLSDYIERKDEIGFYYDPTWNTTLFFPCAVHGVAEAMNDHGYYYGYFLRAAVAVAMYDRAWLAQPNIEEGLRRMVRDVTNPSRDDVDYPFLRCFDMFAGHSWGSGAGAYQSGLNAEPSSESVNYAASVMLLGSMLGDTDIEHLGAMLYACETEATLDYWFNQHQDAFPPHFHQPFVGMLWGNGASHRSWFSGGAAQALGVNLLPMQASSIYLSRNPGFWQSLEAVYAEGGEKPAVWPALFYMAEGLVDPTGAIRKMNRLSDTEGSEDHEWSLHPAVCRNWMQSLLHLGVPVHDETCDAMYYAVFHHPNRGRTYAVFNPGPRPLVARFSGGFEMTAKPNSHTTTAVTLAYSESSTNHRNSVFVTQD